MIRSKPVTAPRYDRETAEDLIGICTAISVVSREVAQRLRRQEQRRFREGGDPRHATKTPHAD